MTREEFDLKFQLLDQITEGSIRTFHALSSGGAVVMAHFLEAEPGETTSAILARLDALEPERKSRVVKIMDVEGAPVLVTKFILDFESLQGWLGLERPDTQATQDTQPHSPDPREPGDAAAAHAQPPRSAPPVERGPEAGTGPGEFTRLFQAPKESTASETVPAPVDEPEQTSGAGEFTRLFEAPKESTAPEAASAPVSEPEQTSSPGEFTRLFHAPLPISPSASPQPAAPEPEEPAAESQQTPAADTAPEALTPVSPAATEGLAKQSSEPRSAEAERPSEPPTAAAGEFTQLFRSQPTPSPAPPKVTATPPSRPPDPAADAAAAPGEFTRLFQSPGAADGPEGRAEPADHRDPAPAQPSPSAAAPATDRDASPSRVPPRPAADPSAGGKLAAGKPGVGKGTPSDLAHLVDQGAELRLPEQRKPDLPPASPSLPGLNLHTPPPPATGLPGHPPASTGSVSKSAEPGTGEFTQMFGRARAQENLRHAAAERPPAPRLELPGTGEVARQTSDQQDYAQRLHGLAGEARHSGASPTHASPVDPYPEPSPGGAGEYTRIISAPTPPIAARPEQAPVPAPASTAPASQPQAATWPLVVGLVLVVVLLLALVLFFVLRPA